MTSAVRRAGLALGTTALLVAGSMAFGPAAQAASPTLRVYDATLTEGTGGQAIVAFAVQLSAPAPSTVTFTWGTVAQTAVAPADFTAVPSGTKATIAKGKTSTVLIVKVAADSVDEYSETFAVRLASATGATITDSVALATILDDDAPPVLSLSELPIVEGTGTTADPLPRAVTASLSQVSGKQVSVRYALTPGTAGLGSDLTARTANLIFEPGQQTADVTFDVVGDDVDEPNETFSLTWAGPINVQLPARASARSLVDDDGPLRPAILGSTPLSPSPVDNPVLFGLAPALSTVEVYDNGTCAGAPIASGSAEVFTSTGFAVALSHNTTHTLTVKGTNTVGGADTQCSVTFTYRHDDIAPNAPSVIAVPGTPTQNPAPTVRGSAENGSTVDVYVDTDCLGTPVSTGTDADYGDADGLPLGTLTANAPHVVRVSATDAAGNVSACSAPLTITIDTVGPAAPTGLEVIPAAVTTDATPGLRGTAEAGSTVEVFVDNACTGTVHDSDTAATFASAGGIAIAPALSDGPHDLYARATDVAGNPGACSAAEPVTIDTAAPPAPTNLALIDGTPTANGSVRVSGDAELGSSVTVFRDTGGAGVSCDTVLGTGSASSFGDTNGLTLSPALGDGTYVLRATATDTLGQESACSSDSVTVVVDGSPPAAPTNLVVVQGALTNDPTPSLTGDAEAGSTVGVWVDSPTCSGSPDATGSAGQFGNPAGITVPAPGDGPHQLSARATDALGNPSTCAGPVSVTIDTSAPQAPMGLQLLGAARPTQVVSPRIGGSVEAGATVTLYRDTSPGAGIDCDDVLGSGTADEFGGLVGIALSPPLADGAYLIRATATDEAGNVSPCSLMTAFVEVDTVRPVAPTLNTIDSSPDTNPSATGTAETGSTVRAFLSGNCSGPVAASGTANLFNNPGLALGPLTPATYTASAEAEDAAGNVSACSAAITFDVQP